jgi:hypothetical protein
MEIIVKKICLTQLSNSFKNLGSSKNSTIKLGRWDTNFNKQNIDKRVDWSNHDHCGSELCDKPVIIKNKKIIDYNFDPLLPYCL